MRYELTDLKVFMAIADAKSLSKGALNMHMTSPSASYRLKNIEDALGVSLFLRTSRGMHLTPAGEEVYRYGEKILSNADALMMEISRYNSGVTGHIKVFANSSTMSLLPIPLSNYLAAYPTINIELEEHLSENSVRAVHDGIADIGLVASVVHLRGLESIPFGEDELVFVTPLNHPLASLNHTTINIALNYDLVSVGRNSSNFLYLQQIANKLNRRPNVRVHVHDFDVALRCVQEGVGISLIPLSIAKRSIQQKPISIVRINEPWAKRNQLIVVRSLHSLPEHSKAFIKYLTQPSSI